MGLFGSSLQNWGSGYSLIHILSFPPLGEITSEKEPLGTELCHFQGEVMCVQSNYSSHPLQCICITFFIANVVLELLC